MILDANDLAAGARLDGDLCIIGAGAAGIALALEFADSHHSVVLLAGGSWKETSFETDLYRGGVIPAGSHEPLEENRRRMLGGTTSVWGGRCIPLDPIDYELRSWMENSGWPIRYEEIEPFQRRACRIAEAGDAEFDARRCFPGKQTEILDGFDDENIVTWPLERWSPPTDFARSYRQRLERTKNIRVILNGHAVNIHLQESGEAVSEIQARNQGGTRFSVRCGNYVLAAGGLENPRLLLASRDVCAKGVGNQNDQVGRYYQSHLFGVHGYAELRRPLPGFVYDFERDKDGVYCRRRFWVTPTAQKSGQIGNVIGFFFRPDIGHAVHRNALFSATYLAKAVKSALANGGLNRLSERITDDGEVLMEHVKAVVSGAPSLLPQLAQLLFHRTLARRRLPIILPPASSSQLFMCFQGEHAPNPGSRVVLSPASEDALGVPRIEARIKFSPIDHETVLAFYRLLAKRFQQSSLGTFHYDETKLAAQLASAELTFNSNAHHIGTTRMGENPATSVVDRNAKVHDIDNLYVAGSSIFPTSGHANPTLPLLATTMRLADHLKSTNSSS